MNEVCVSVLAIGSGRYRVDVPGSMPTSHEVTLPGDYLAGLGLTGVPAERVIAESFRFLL